MSLGSQAHVLMHVGMLLVNVYMLRCVHQWNPTKWYLPLVSSELPVEIRGYFHMHAWKIKC